MVIVDMACCFLMMVFYQVVLLKEVQDMCMLFDLFFYIEKFMEFIILVICYKYKKFNFNLKFGKVLKKNVLIFEFKFLYDNQVLGWISNYFKSYKLIIILKVGELIVENLGIDLLKIVNELDKLVLNFFFGIQVDDVVVE